MTRVPSRWIEVGLEDVLAPLDDGRIIHQGWSPQCEAVASEGNDVWASLKTTAIQSGTFLPEHNKRLPDGLTPRPLLEVRQGDLVITCAGPRARCGVACLIRETRPRLMLSGKMYRFRVDDRFIDPRYMEAYLLSSIATRAIDRMKTGISDSGLNLTHGRFRKLRFPLAPRQEQTRVVAAIEEQFSRLDAAERSLRHAELRLESLRSATLATAVTDCEAIELGALVTDLRYGTSMKCSPEGKGPPVVRIPNVQGGALDLSVLKFANDPTVDFSSFALEAGDLLFVRTNGSRDLIGRVASVDGAEGMAFASYLIRARPDRSRLESRFAAIALSSPQARALVEARAATTAGQYNLNLAALRSLPIPLPSLDAQRSIIVYVEHRLSVVEAMRSKIKTALGRSGALRRAILEHAFTGKLTTEEPSDEPASGLLDRIATERMAHPTQSRRRRKVPA